jgi:DNA-binding transcriptional regulator LsrR (DeoR family)
MVGLSPCGARLCKNIKPKSGENHPNAKLSDKDIDIIRHLVLSLGKTHKEVANIFGVASSTISGIINSGRRQG